MGNGADTIVNLMLNIHIIAPKNQWNGGCMNSSELNRIKEILNCIRELQDCHENQIKTVDPKIKMGILVGEVDWLCELLDICEEKMATYNVTKDSGEDKLEFSRFFSSKVLRRRAEFMRKYNSLKTPDSWKKGIPEIEYVASLFRHFMDIWSFYEAGRVECDIRESLCALMFNAEGLLHEILKDDENGE
jgi:hypothetical protein